ncbi:MAG: glycoside hydrolase family 3 protein, partial [Erysipelotrichaceae bacterium]|nr:glycoside hydrolase family 3 protein [Erysipelotrichaceae bacterium]
MVSHSALNGVKMHENKEFIEKLKNEMGFEGFIVSDWNAIQNTSKTSYYDQVVTAIDAGIDMLMEVDRFDKVIEIIVAAVNKGELSKERIDDAVLRILKVKKELGVFEDPLFDDLQLKAKDVGSDAYRQVAKEAVEKSLVL